MEAVDEMDAEVVPATARQVAPADGLAGIWRVHRFEGEVAA
jgi:hypothetical protein